MILKRISQGGIWTIYWKKPLGMQPGLSGISYTFLQVFPVITSPCQLNRRNHSDNRHAQRFCVCGLTVASWIRA